MKNCVSIIIISSQSLLLLLSLLSAFNNNHFASAGVMLDDGSTNNNMLRVSSRRTRENSSNQNDVISKVNRAKEKGLRRTEKHKKAHEQYRQRLQNLRKKTKEDVRKLERVVEDRAALLVKNCNGNSVNSLGRVSNVNRVSSYSSSNGRNTRDSILSVIAIWGGPQQFADFLKCENKRQDYARHHAQESRAIADRAARESTKALEELLKQLQNIANEAKNDASLILADRNFVKELPTPFPKKHQYKKALERELSDTTLFSVKVDREIEQIQRILVKNLCFALHGPEGMLDSNKKEKDFEQAVVTVAEEYLAANGVSVEVLYAEATAGTFTPAAPTPTSDHIEISTGLSLIIDEGEESPARGCWFCRDGGHESRNDRQGVLNVFVRLGMICNCAEEAPPGDAFNRRLEEQEDQMFFDQDDLVQEAVVVLLQEHVTDIFGENVEVEGIPCESIEAEFHD